MSMTREQFLAKDVEVALKTYLGTDSFPSDQWPALARAFADVVGCTGEIGSYAIAGDDSPEIRVEKVQDFLGALKAFHAATINIVE